MSGRDQPGTGALSEPGTGYTSNPYESATTPTQSTERLSTAEYQPQWGYTAAPVTPPYGEALPLEAPPPPPASSAEPEPPRARGSLWPWVVAAVAVLALSIVGSAAAYLTTVSATSLDNDAKLNTQIVSAPAPQSTAPGTPTFVPRFVAFSGTVQSNDGTTLVIAPKDGSPVVTVVTDAQTSVLLGGGQGVAEFKPGDGVFVQGATQQDGKIMARMIIGSLFGN